MPPGPWPHWSGTLPDLSIKTRLPLRATSGRVSTDHLCAFSPWWGQTRGRFADTFWRSYACLFPSIGSWSRLAPRTTQLEIKDCPFGPQPTDHSVPPRPITNNYKLRNSRVSDWCKARETLKGIIVNPDKKKNTKNVWIYIKESCCFLFLCNKSDAEFQVQHCANVEKTSHIHN